MQEREGLEILVVSFPGAGPVLSPLQVTWSLPPSVNCEKCLISCISLRRCQGSDGLLSCMSEQVCGGYVLLRYPRSMSVSAQSQNLQPQDGKLLIT